MVTERANIGYFSGTWRMSDEYNDHTRLGFYSDQEVANKVRFLDAALNDTAYVRLDGSARDGTIGKVINLTFYGKALLTRSEFTETLTMTPSDEFLIERRLAKAVWDENRRKTVLDHIYTYEEYLANNCSMYDDFSLLMDDRSVVKPTTFTSHLSDSDDPRGFSWLEGYTGPTVRKFTKGRQPAKQVEKFFDTYGKVVEIGDLVALSLDGRIVAGVVTKFSTTGETATVTVGDETKQVNWSNKLMVIDSKLKSRAMVDKLSRTVK